MDRQRAVLPAVPPRTPIFFGSPPPSFITIIITAIVAPALCPALARAQGWGGLLASPGLSFRLFDLAGIIGVFGLLMIGFTWVLGHDYTPGSRHHRRHAHATHSSSARATAGGAGAPDRDIEPAAEPVSKSSRATGKATGAAGYELGRVIGQGGMGTVYEGRDVTLGRRVAIKELRPELQRDAESRERFLREARTVARITHPNVVTIHAVLNTPKHTRLVFEYVRGLTLADYIDKCPGRRVPLREAARIARQICAALDHAHTKHVIHRDLKPSNIMIADSGRVKVMDFGIARQAKDSLMTVTNTVMGTPSYMAPEMEDGVVGREGDLYSLGVCLYEMLTGVLPFDGPGSQRLKEEGRFAPAAQVNASLPPGLDTFFVRALAPKPDRRFASAREFLADFLGSAA